MVFLTRQVDSIAVADPLNVNGLQAGGVSGMAVHHSMTGLISQVAALAEHANNIFTGLINEATISYTRISKLNQKIIEVNQINTEAEAIIKQSTLDVFLNKRGTKWSANNNEESQIFTKATIPPNVDVIYKTNARPPLLESLDIYMEGGQKALALYTNPNFFIDEWVSEQLKQREEAKKARRERRAKAKEGKSKEARNTQAPIEVQKMKITRYDPITGEKILVDAPVRSSISLGNNANTMRFNQSLDLGDDTPPPPPTDIYNVPSFNAPQPPTSSYGTLKQSGSSSSTGNSYYNETPNFNAPPPPPGGGMGMGMGGMSMGMSQGLSHSSSGSTMGGGGGGGPPPPPPPPPPPMPGGSTNAGAGSESESSALGSALLGAKLKTTQPVVKKVDERSGLLESIKAGNMKLKSANERVLEEAPKKEETMSVAGILARRIAIVGDSESEDEDDDDGEWDD